MPEQLTAVPGQRVAAVVVTYNRLALLQECVDALRTQSYPLAAIIIINNSSNDGTTEWLAKQPDITAVTQENRGGAFGFYTGIKTASEQGYEWIWCMDDDGRPAADAVEQLMKYAGRKPCVMNALVLDKDNPANLVFKTAGYTKADEIPDPVIEGAANPFNGTLIHLDVVLKAGLPMKDLTIWGDETEYYNRIMYRNGFPIFTVVASHHYHPAQYSVFYKREWDAGSDWKVYFFIRNKAFVYKSRHRQTWRARLDYYKFLAGFLGTLFVYQKNARKAKMRLLWLAARDGFAGNTEKGIAEVRALLSSGL